MARTDPNTAYCIIKHLRCNVSWEEAEKLLMVIAEECSEKHDQKKRHKPARKNIDPLSSYRLWKATVFVASISAEYGAACLLPVLRELQAMLKEGWVKLDKDTCWDIARISDSFPDGNGDTLREVAFKLRTGYVRDMLCRRLDSSLRGGNDVTYSDEGGHYFEDSERIEQALWMLERGQDPAALALLAEVTDDHLSDFAYLIQAAQDGKANKARAAQTVKIIEQISERMSSDEGILDYSTESRLLIEIGFMLLPNRVTGDEMAWKLIENGLNNLSHTVEYVKSESKMSHQLLNIYKRCPQRSFEILYERLGPACNVWHQPYERIMTQLINGVDDQGRMLQFLREFIEFLGQETGARIQCKWQIELLANSLTNREEELKSVLQSYFDEWEGDQEGDAKDWYADAHQVEVISNLVKEVNLKLNQETSIDLMIWLARRKRGVSAAVIGSLRAAQKLYNDGETELAIQFVSHALDVYFIGRDKDYDVSIETGSANKALVEFFSTCAWAFDRDIVTKVMQVKCDDIRQCISLSAILANHNFEIGLMYFIKYAKERGLRERFLREGLARIVFTSCLGLDRDEAMKRTQKIAEAAAEYIVECGGLGYSKGKSQIVISVFEHLACQSLADAIDLYQRDDPLLKDADDDILVWQLIRNINTQEDAVSLYEALKSRERKLCPKQVIALAFKSRQWEEEKLQQCVIDMASKTKDRNVDSLIDLELIRLLVSGLIQGRTSEDMEDIYCALQTADWFRFEVDKQDRANIVQNEMPERLGCIIRHDFRRGLELAFCIESDEPEKQERFIRTLCESATAKITYKLFECELYVNETLVANGG